MNQLPAGLIEYIVEQLRTIYSIPAPTFSEGKRAEYVVREFEALGLQQAHIDLTGNVLACWPGGSEKPLIISAHLDTVHSKADINPIVETEDSLCGPGIGDNTLGIAALLGLGKVLVDQQPQYPGDIWLVGNVCEEGLGNLAGMNAIADHFGEDARAYLVLEGLGLGQVCHRGLGVARFNIMVETTGGHSWVDFGKPSAIHEIAGVITSMAESTIPRKPRSSLNVGVIQGGTSINTIAAKAWCELDLRSEDQITLAKLIKLVRKIIESKERPGVRITMEAIGSRPAGGIQTSHPLVKLVLDVLAEQGVASCLEIGSTDANVPLSRGIPAVCIGITHGSNPHTTKEFIELKPIRLGMAQLLKLVAGIWDIQ